MCDEVVESSSFNLFGSASELHRLLYTRRTSEGCWICFVHRPTGQCGYGGLQWGYGGLQWGYGGLDYFVHKGKQTPRMCSTWQCTKSKPDCCLSNIHLRHAPVHGNLGCSRSSWRITPPLRGGVKNATYILPTLWLSFGNPQNSALPYLPPSLWGELTPHHWR